MFADRYTKFEFVDLLKEKSEALASLKKFILSVEAPQMLKQHNAKDFLLRAVKDVLFECRHSTGEYHTRDATTERVRREVLQETAGDGKILAHCLGSSQDDVRSRNSPRNKDQELGCEKRRSKMSGTADARDQT